MFWRQTSEVKISLFLRSFLINREGSVIMVLREHPLPVRHFDCTHDWDHFGWATHTLSPLLPWNSPPFLSATAKLTCSLAPSFFYPHHRKKKAARKKGPSKCQVVCASVKNACWASSPLNAALALVSVMSLDNWIRYSLTLSESHSFPLCQWQQKNRTGKLSVWTDFFETLL